MQRYRAERCPCGDPICQSWHVWPAAAVQGVRFTQAQAEAVATMLNGGEATGADTPADRE